MKTFQTLQELAACIGQTVAVSPWTEITQEQVNMFAEATGDHQWIHIDVEKAKAGPFGAPIAHGFLTLEDDTDFLYKCTSSYVPQNEHSLAWDDPEVGIAWPLEGIEPKLSAKDSAGVPLSRVQAFA